MKFEKFMGKQLPVCECRLKTQWITGSYWCRSSDGKGPCERNKNKTTSRRRRNK